MALQSTSRPDSTIDKCHADQLDDKLYFYFFRSFLECSSNLKDDIGVCLKTIRGSTIKNLKWLTIGPGPGCLEESVLSSLQAQLPAVAVEHIEAYEPNAVSHGYLNTRIYQDKAWGDDTNNVHLFNTPCTSSTEFLNKNLFNFVTISHVFYYILDKQERAALMRHIFNNLAEKGVVMVIHMAEELDGKGDVMTAFWAEFMPRFTLGSTNVAQHSQSNDVISDKTLVEDFRFLSETGTASEDISTYVSYAFFDSLDTSRPPSSLTLQTLCFFTQLDLASVPAALMSEMMQWLQRHCDKQQDGSYKMFHPTTVLTYTKR